MGNLLFEQQLGLAGAASLWAGIIAAAAWSFYWGRQEAVRSKRLRVRPSPRGVVSLTLAADAHHAEAILRSWRRQGLLGYVNGEPVRPCVDPYGRIRVSARVNGASHASDPHHNARRALLADNAFAVGYALTLALLAFLAATAVAEAWRPWLVAAGAGAVAAGVLDLMENALATRMVRKASYDQLSRPSRFSVRLTRYTAVGKFLLVGGAAFLIVGVPGVIVALLVTALATIVRNTRQLPTCPPSDTPLESTNVSALPEKECDVVMKGGITSGVIYPKALFTLATKYRFRAIGGTSAGAIAAAIAAAAEHHRVWKSRSSRDGDLGRGVAPDDPASHGFEGMIKAAASLRDDVTPRRRRLRMLFQPSKRTRPLLDLADILTAPDPWMTKIRQSVLLAGRFGWRTAGGVGLIVVLLAAPLLLAVHMGFLSKGTFAFDAVWRPAPAALAGLGLTGLPVGLGAIQRITWLFVVAVTVIAIVTVGVSIGLLGVITRILRLHAPDLGYGLCPGTTQGRSRHPALTNWLTEHINVIAGLPAPPAGDGDGWHPLTFGDLWSPGARAPDDKPAIPEVDLQLITTCLNQLRPLRLPDNLDTPGERWWFSPSEFKELFPEPVVNHLCCTSRGTAVRPDTGEQLCQLPPPRDLPVVVATRMSLSFPLLFSAVPLWAEHTHITGNTEWERCWFSDGGITSNFPIHFFDRPLPRRPTFGFNLRSWVPGEEGTKEFDVPTRLRDGAEPYWSHIGEGDLGGFATAMLNSARSWRDEALSRYAGYRERIVHIYHSDVEGGMNLHMPADVIARLEQRGASAAAALLDRYVGAPSDGGEESPEVSWTAHRWVRAAIAFRALDEVVQALVEGWGWPRDPAAMYQELLKLPPGGIPPDPYPLDEAQRNALQQAVTLLEALESQLELLRSRVGLEEEPRMQLRLSPDV